jgi:hypothetical protein
MIQENLVVSHYEFAARKESQQNNISETELKKL